MTAPIGVWYGWVFKMASASCDVSSHPRCLRKSNPIVGKYDRRLGRYAPKPNAHL